MSYFDAIIPPFAQNVHFVVTCRIDSSNAKEFAGRADCLALTVSELNTSERTAAVRNLLGRYGKILRESGFRNQVSSNHPRLLQYPILTDFL